MADQSPETLSIFSILRKYSIFCGHRKTSKQRKNKTETKAYKQAKLCLPVVMEKVNILKTSKIRQYVSGEGMWGWQFKYLEGVFDLNYLGKKKSF